MTYQPKQCAFPLCPNKEDPRWGGFCDGHGCATDEQWGQFVVKAREAGAKVRDLLADVARHLAKPPTTGERLALLERIDAVLEGEK